MDRRERKTRTAIFTAFIELVSRKNYNKITVEEIINLANVGRATFYSHFETKDYLLKELAEELFCHIIDSTLEIENNHVHIFSCDATDSVFLHLLKHIQNNDNNILKLLSSQNNELFLNYFKANLYKLVKRNLSKFDNKNYKILPESFIINHITTVFVETVKWWIDDGMKVSAQTIYEYFISITK